MSRFLRYMKTVRQRLAPKLIPLIPGVVLRTRRKVIDRKRLWGPKVSVIVPIYNVQEYLDDCLLSIRKQKYRNLEIILVNDGSTDESEGVARKHLREDYRIRLINKSNGGLSSARNAGVAVSKGEYIAFSDSDDTLPNYAVEKMVKSMLNAPCDFVVGSLRRQSPSSSWVPEWAQNVHRSNREQITVDDLPEIMLDVFAWNKLYDANFFRSIIKEYPEGVVYEDQVPSVKAYLAPGVKFNVLNSVVYNWTLREDGTSITQSKVKLKDVQDRTLALRQSAAIVQEQGTEKIQKYWFSKVLGFDLLPYYELIPRTSSQYQSVLVNAVAELTEMAPSAAWSQMEPASRALAYLTSRNELDAVFEVLSRLADNGKSAPLRHEDGALRADLSVFDDSLAGLGLQYVLVAPESLPLITRLTAAYWESSKTLLLEAIVGVRGAPQSEAKGELTAFLENLSTGERNEVDANFTVDPSVNAFMNEAHGNYESNAVEIRIDKAALDSSMRGQDLTDWRLVFNYKLYGYTFTGPITQRDTRGSAGRLTASVIEDGTRVRMRYSGEHGLTLRKVAVTVIANEISLNNRRITAQISAVDEVELIRAEVVCRSLKLKEKAELIPSEVGKNDYIIRLTVPRVRLAASSTSNHHWRLFVITSTGKRFHVDTNWTQQQLFAVQPPVDTLYVEVADTGQLALCERPLQAMVDTFDVSETSTGSWILHVQGWASRVDERQPVVELRSNSQQLPPTEFAWHGLSRRFNAKFVLGRNAEQAGQAIVDGAYWLVVMDGSNDTAANRMVEMSREVSATFPMSIVNRKMHITATRTPRAGGLWLVIGPGLMDRERTRWGRSQMLISARSSELIDGVLFESYGGKSATDSSLALSLALRESRPDITQYWSVAHAGVEVPEFADALVIGSTEWLEVLSRARWLVNNNNFPFYFRKREGQFYLQVWHGTPLKRIGNHVPGANLSLSYRRLMQREATYWDVMLAQNTYSSDIFRECFGFDGSIICEGYPRNDSLFSDKDGQVRKRVRQALGIRSDQQVVLYAPTWRDDVRAKNNSYALATYLDFAEINDTLGDETVVLLRGHANTLRDQNRSDVSRSVIDVSRYPELNELFLAADVLVTDYSSIMFDFAVTSKPILFMVPDLQQYAESTRGFYVPLEDIAPGPLRSRTSEIIEDLRELKRSGVAVQRSQAYLKFQKSFCSLDDGHAADRVIRAIPQLQQPIYAIKE